MTHQGIVVFIIFDEQDPEFLFDHASSILRGKEDKLKPAFPNSFRCSINIIAGIFQTILK